MTNKDALEHLSQFVCASLDCWGHTDVTTRHDQEYVLEALTQLVRERRGHSTYLELAPAASHESGRAIERATQPVVNQSVARLEFVTGFRSTLDMLKLTCFRVVSSAWNRLSFAVLDWRPMFPSRCSRSPFRQVFLNTASAGKKDS